MREWPPLDDRLPARDAVMPLLLAVFVIVVTAFLVTVVLDMGQHSDGNRVAQASVTFQPDADSIRVAFTSTTRPGATLDVTVSEVAADAPVASTTLARIGADHTFVDLDDGEQYRVAVIAEWRDQRSVVTIETGQL